MKYVLIFTLAALAYAGFTAGAPAYALPGAFTAALLVALPKLEV